MVKANKGINVEIIIIGFKKLKIKFIKKRKEKKMEEERKKGKLHRTTKAQSRGRGL